MTIEEKKLLFKDLCARVPYSVQVEWAKGVFKFDETHQGIGALFTRDEKGKLSEDFDIIMSGCFYGEVIKPYLRPLSSMTEKEKEELYKAFNIKASVVGEYGISSNNAWWVKDRQEPLGFDTVPYASMAGVIDFFYTHHLDFRGFIPMGLALEAPEGMYKFE